MEEFLTPQRLPQVVRAPERARVDELVAMLGDRRRELEHAVLHSGALLFRGFGVHSATEFRRVVEAFDGAATLPYVGGDSPRARVAENVYTSTDVPPGVRLPLHNEMSYLPAYPHHIWFYCEHPASEGGETTLADGRAVYRDLDPNVRERFERDGVKYILRYSARSAVLALLNRRWKIGKSWAEAFETDDPAEAEARARSLGVAFEWLPSGQLETSIVCPATVVHPQTGERAWFNQAHAFCMTPRSIGLRYYVLANLPLLRHFTRTHDARYGDDEPIARRDLDHVLDVLDRHAAYPRWEAGDVMLADNRLCMHGRNSFRGQRRILVALTA